MLFDVEERNSIEDEQFSFVATPLVLIHGILADKEVWNPVLKHIKKKMPKSRVICIEIGNGYRDSLEMPLMEQLTIFAQIVREHPSLQNGFDILSHSQGGILARGYIQFYSFLDVYPKVRRLVQIFSPNGGVYGIPNFTNYLSKPLLCCCGSSPYWCYFNEYSFAGYWRDPYNLSTYKRIDSFLARLNQVSDLSSQLEKERSKKTITNLDGMLLLSSCNDTTVLPSTSCFFDEYAPNSKDIIGLEDENHSLNQRGDDPLGLLEMKRKKRVHKCSVTINHEEATFMRAQKMYDEVIIPFLLCDDVTTAKFSDLIEIVVNI
eukprot:TRINITY_DN2556_c0_g1_i1.p1 TRINITY_DN2556_c0_g1~~TRINITY_DN2556_c0_g1_i1.p1  ORF type:complete len:319 (+),score=81.87 TRINITY_DN2556_c0_g1_i1:103-1059(+)